MSLDKYFPKRGGTSTTTSATSLSGGEGGKLPGEKKNSKQAVDKQKVLSSIKENSSKAENERNNQQGDKSDGEAPVTDSLRQLLTSVDWNQKLKEREDQLILKDNQLESLEKRKDQLEHHIGNVKTTTKDYKKHSTEVIVKSLKELYKSKREFDLGYGEYGYLRREEPSFRFIEGNKFANVKREINEAERAVKQIDQQLASAGLEPSSKTALQKQRVYLITRLATLAGRVRQLNNIKDCLVPILRARQFEKECQFYKNDWPIESRTKLQPLEMIHRGSHEVYRCYDLESNCFKVLKIYKHQPSNKNILNDFCLPDKHLVRSGVLEQLQHPNIARIEKVLSVEHSVSYIVMEHLEGHNLDYRLSFYNRIPESEAKYILFCMLSALDYLNKKLVGVSFLPKNVVIADNGCVKLLGLDSAKVSNESGTASVQYVLSTMENPYLAPEYYNPSTSKTSQLSCKTDVWALGVLFVKMLFGTLPFKNNPAAWHKDFMKLDLAQMEKEEQIEISEQAKTIISDMLSVSEKHRKNARELLASPYFC